MTETVRHFFKRIFADFDRTGFAAFLCCIIGFTLLSGSYIPTLLRPFILSYPKFFAAQTFVVLMLILLLWRIPVSRPWVSGGLDGQLSKCFFPSLLLLYFLWNMVSMSWAVWPYGAYHYVSREAVYFALAFCACLLLTNRKRWLTTGKFFSGAIFLAALLQTVVILRQYMPQRHELPLRRVISIFLSHPYMSGNPNTAVSIVLLAVLLSIGFAIRSTFPGAEGGRGRMSKIFSWVFCLATLIVASFIIYAASSLAGYIAVIVASLAYFICLFPFSRRATIVGGIMVLIIASALFTVCHTPTRQRIINNLYGRESTLQARGIMWIAATEMTIDRPLQGSGPSGYLSRYYEFEPPLGRVTRYTKAVIPNHPHNEFLRVSSELGLIGLALYFLVLAVPLVISYPALRASPSDFQPVGFAFWCALLAFITQTSFGISVISIDFALPFWSLVGLLASVAYWPKKSHFDDGITESVSSERSDANQTVESCGPQNPDTGRKKRKFFVAFQILLTCLLIFYWHEFAVKGYADVYRLREAHVILRGLNEMRSKGLHEEERESFIETADHLEKVLQKSSSRQIMPHEILRFRLRAGRVLTACGLHGRAIEHLEYVQDAVPGLINVEAYLGCSYLADGHDAEAEKLLTNYLENHPDDHRWYPYLWRVDRAATLNLLGFQVFEVDDLANSARVGMLAGYYANAGLWEGIEQLIEELQRRERKEGIHEIGDLLEAVRQKTSDPAIEKEVLQLENKLKMRNQ